MAVWHTLRKWPGRTSAAGAAGSGSLPRSDPSAPVARICPAAAGSLALAGAVAAAVVEGCRIRVRPLGLDGVVAVVVGGEGEGVVDDEDEDEDEDGRKDVEACPVVVAAGAAVMVVDVRPSRQTTMPVRPYPQPKRTSGCPPSACGRPSPRAGRCRSESQTCPTLPGPRRCRTAAGCVACSPPRGSRRAW